MIVYTDLVLFQIGQKIASYEPEKGGALLGIPNSNVITCLIEDPVAQVTSSSYLPSRELTSKVQKLETKLGLVFKGVIHSHPGNMSQPSLQDRYAFSQGLKINPRMAEFVAPIVTTNQTSSSSLCATSEILLSPRGKITSYTAFRMKANNGSYKYCQEKVNNNSVELEQTDCTIMPILEHTTELVKILKKKMGKLISQVEGYIEINGILFSSITCQFLNEEIIILFPPSYPITKPIVLLTKSPNTNKQETTEIFFPWLFSPNNKMQLVKFCGAKIIEQKVDKIF